MLVFVSNKSNKRSHSHAQLIACTAGTYQHVEIGAGLAAFPQAAETRSQAGTWSACATCCTTFLLCLLLRLSPPVLRLQFACRVQRGAAQSCAALSRHYCHAYVYPDAGCCYRPWRRDHAQNAIMWCGATGLHKTYTTVCHKCTDPATSSTSPCAQNGFQPNICMFGARLCGGILRPHTTAPAALRPHLQHILVAKMP